MAVTPFFARIEHFDAVDSTNDVVRDWLRDGTAEVCVASADEQRRGRGREGRRWTAPPGTSLLLSVGYRPTWLPPERAWRLGATVALAMADAAEAVASIPDGAIRLKWPNDLAVVDDTGPSHGNGSPIALRKLGGVLGESEGLGTDDPRVVVGIGINADWPAADFPDELSATMSSLRELAGSPIDTASLRDAFIRRLEARTEALRADTFDAATWTARQVTSGHLVRLETATGHEDVRALGVDPSTGALIVEDGTARRGERLVHAGEIVHVRLVAQAPSPGVASPSQDGPTRGGV